MPLSYERRKEMNIRDCVEVYDVTPLPRQKGWTATTGRHITAFCRMTKKEWDAMPLYEEEKDLGREL